MSVDLSGSTAFKARAQGQLEDWTLVFQRFFEDFPVWFAEDVQKLPELCAGRAAPEAMRVWKFVGDEILFVKEISAHWQAVYYCAAFRSTLARYAEELRTKHATTRLGVKGTVWGGGFPVGNTSVNTRVSDGSTGSLVVADYIGPAIDLGFRLARHADARRIPVSPDIALMVAHAAVNSESMRRIPFIFDEPQAMAGIAEGSPYPLISIDRSDEPQTPEDKLLRRERRCANEQLRVYLEDVFYERGLHGLRRPFIEGDESREFSTVDPEIRRLYARRWGEDMASQGTPPRPEEEGPGGTITTPKEPVKPVGS